MMSITCGSPPATPNPSRALGTHYTVLAHVLAQRLRALLRAPHPLAVSDKATAVPTTPPEPSDSKPSSHATAVPSRGLGRSAPPPEFVSCDPTGKDPAKSTARKTAARRAPRSAPPSSPPSRPGIKSGAPGSLSRKDAGRAPLARALAARAPRDPPPKGAALAVETPPRTAGTS